MHWANGRTLVERVVSVRLEEQILQSNLMRGTKRRIGQLQRGRRQIRKQKDPADHDGVEVKYRLPILTLWESINVSAHVSDRSRSVPISLLAKRTDELPGRRGERSQLRPDS